MALQLLIGGNDRTSRVFFPSLQVTQNLTSQVDTMAVQLRLPATALAEVPAANDEIQLLDGATKLFAGKIVSPPRSLLRGSGEIQVNVLAQDYQFDLTRKLVIEGYPTATVKTAGEIVQHIISNYLTGFGITAGTVEDGPVMESYPVNYEPASDAIERLAKIAGFDWYVDYDKALHFYSGTGGTSVAPWNLTVAAAAPYLASAPFEGLSYQQDITQLRNVVTVRGAETPSEIVTQTETSTGVERSYILDYGQVVSGTLTMTVDGTAQLVGEEGKADPTTVEWLVNYKNRSVQATAGTTTPANGLEVVFEYRYLSQIIVQARDEPSITEFGEFEHVVVNPEIKDRRLAIKVAQAELQHFSQPSVVVSYSTTRSGLRSGMRQRVTIPRLDLDAVFLIRSVTMTTPSYVAEATDFQGIGYFRRWSVQAQRVSA